MSLEAEQGTISIALTPLGIKDLFLIKAKLNKADIELLMDSGCSGNFIHPEVVRQLNLPTLERAQPLRVRHVEGKTFGISDWRAMFSLVIGEHFEYMAANIVPIGQHKLILGMPWLVHHNPAINWVTRELSFNSCKGHKKVSKEY